MLAQVLVSSATAGAVYALIALGFVLIHKGTGVVHFGYGDQVTFGAYLALMAQVLIGLSFKLVDCRCTSAFRRAWCRHLLAASCGRCRMRRCCRGSSRASRWGR